jgi:hypothetical protein
VDDIELTNVNHADTMFAGLNEHETEVAVGLHSPAGWVVYEVSPDVARELAKTLWDGADIADGKRMPEPDAYERGAAALDGIEHERERK